MLTGERAHVGSAHGLSEIMLKRVIITTKSAIEPMHSSVERMATQSKVVYEKMALKV